MNCGNELPKSCKLSKIKNKKVSNVYTPQYCLYHILVDLTDIVVFTAMSYKVHTKYA